MPRSPSIAIAWGLLRHLGCTEPEREKQQRNTGVMFQRITADFIRVAFALLHHLRPGKWEYGVEVPISEFSPYAHLGLVYTRSHAGPTRTFSPYAHLGLTGRLKNLVSNVKRKDRELGVMLEEALGAEYTIKPDIVIGRWPVSDEEINQHAAVLTNEAPIAALTPLRERNHPAKKHMVLHASISCKWTMRSGRAQNTRTEALTLIRYRKGPLPHILAVTAEPLPSRISSLALGTGDLDCVYHFALLELEWAVEEIGNIDQLEILRSLVEGHRLRDISDLPFDLAV